MIWRCSPLHDRLEQARALSKTSRARIYARVCASKGGPKLLRLPSRDVSRYSLSRGLARELPLMGQSERTSYSLISLDGQSSETEKVTNSKIHSRVALNM